LRVLAGISDQWHVFLLQQIFPHFTPLIPQMPMRYLINLWNITVEQIFKYSLDVNDYQTIRLPEKHEILSVQTQNNRPFMWIKVDASSNDCEVLIITHGTGHTVDEKAKKFIGTYQLDDGFLVFHVFQGD